MSSTFLLYFENCNKVLSENKEQYFIDRNENADKYIEENKEHINGLKHKFRIGNKRKYKFANYPNRLFKRSELSLLPRSKSQKFINNFDIKKINVNKEYLFIKNS